MTMDKADRMLADIEQNGTKSKGQKEMIRHLQGERLSARQMVLAKCYDCMGFYSDGRGADCEMPCCPNYPLMPYRKQGEKYVGKGGGKPMTEEHKAKLMAGKRAKLDV
jgi:hypothetical protein